MGEVVITALLCGLLGGGATEVRHEFVNLGVARAVRIDCETPTHVIEVGLDTSSGSRDSLHQALFAAELTGKAPVVILIDTDGVEGRYEYEMRVVAARAGVAYRSCSRGFIERWQATSPWRDVGLDKSLDDLPRNAAAAVHCDLGALFDMPGAVPAPTD